MYNDDGNTCIAFGVRNIQRSFGIVRICSLNGNDVDNALFIYVHNNICSLLNAIANELTHKLLKIELAFCNAWKRLPNC